VEGWEVVPPDRGAASVPRAETGRAMNAATDFLIGIVLRFIGARPRDPDPFDDILDYDYGR
jgi:hypothetical protein